MKKKRNKTAWAHAKYILNLWKNSKLVPPPVDGSELLLVEYDLAHQIRELIVIIDAGVTTYFFRNPYVKA